MATNYEEAFEPRPAVYEAWQQLNGAIKAQMDLRRYELATLAAARRLRSSYCCLAHGRVLAESFGEPVARIAADHRAAGLDEIDVAVMDLAEQVVDDATAVSEADLQGLRDLGLSQEEVMDVILAAAARCFFSKTLDGLGVRPDPGYRDLEPGLRHALVVGRPMPRAEYPGLMIPAGASPSAARTRPGWPGTPGRRVTRRSGRARQRREYRRGCLRRR
jgi:alkylhydroperoxidase family enzyme